MPVSEAASYRYNVFDVTKVWPHKDYPLIKYGKLVLNRNPENYFAEVEQSAFAPSHLVPGVEPSLDRMLQGRLFSYADTHRHRLGPNYLQIPINCPYSNRAKNMQRDGSMTIENHGSAPNYFPNSLPKGANNPVLDKSAAIKSYEVKAEVARYDRYSVHPNSDYEQPGNFYRQVLKEDERERLCDNIASHLCHARKEVQGRMLDIFTKVDKDYGRRVGQLLQKFNGAKL
jgi:catalase